MLDWARKSAGKANGPEDSSSRGTNMQGGLVAGTLVASTAGWIPVEKISVGDMVMTFDDGLQEVVGVTRRLHPLPGSSVGMRPLLSVPAGLLGNRRPILLPEGQAMLVESDFAEEFLGDPFAAMDSSELLGLPGVRKILPEDRVVVVTLSFAADQMIFVEGQALAHCGAARIDAPMSIEDAIWQEESRYQVLSHADAELVIAGMASASDMDGVTHPGMPGARLA